MNLKNSAVKLPAPKKNQNRKNKKKEKRDT